VPVQPSALHTTSFPTSSTISAAGSCAAAARASSTAPAPAGPRRPTLRHPPIEPGGEARSVSSPSSSPRPATCAQSRGRDLRRPLPSRARAGRRPPSQHTGAQTLDVAAQGSRRGQAERPARREPSTSSIGKVRAGRAIPAGHRTATHQPTRASAGPVPPASRSATEGRWARRRRASSAPACRWLDVRAVMGDAADHAGARMRSARRGRATWMLGRWGAGQMLRNLHVGQLRQRETSEQLPSLGPLAFACG